MATNTQFAIAVHILAGLGYRSDGGVTSAELAMSVNTSASFVRRVLAKLSRAGLVKTATGQRGRCWLAKRPDAIDLLDVYRAVNSPKAFAVHTYAPQRQCAVSCNIKCALDAVLDKAQRSMEQSLKKISLAEVIGNLKKP